MKRLLAILIVLLGVSPLAAQDISPALLEDIESIEAFTSEARDLDLLQEVDRRFPARSDAIEQVTGIVRADVPPEEAERMNVFYVAFDFLEPGDDYLTYFLEALEAQVGGYYDPDTKEMNTLLITGGELGDELPLFERIIYAHEFVHALQDQYFDLNMLEEVTADNPDQTQALVSLIEGDATLVMNIYTQEISSRNPLGTAMQLLAQGIRTNTLTLPPGLPEIVAAELLSAYTDGMVFVSALQADGGWEAVNDAFQPENLPQSTEQILHPEKYLNGEGPLAVEFIDPPLDPAWQTVWDTTLGEFYLRQYLRTQLPNNLANRAAAGWGGDHYQIYRHSENGDLAWLLRIEWDSAQEAAEFADAYTEFAGERFEGVVADNSCWSTAGEALCFIDDASSTTIAYAPTLDMAGTLIDSQA